MASSPNSCLQRNDWICGEYLTTRADLIASSTLEHVVLTAVSVAIGLAVALPLGVLAFRFRRVGAVVLGASTALYTIPSLALFPLLLAVGLPFGLSIVVVGLALLAWGLVKRGARAVGNRL